MSLPKHLQETFSPEEIQFLIENEPIKIFPRMTTRQKVRSSAAGTANSQSRISWKMITTDSTNLNNMVAMQSTKVALWIALLLKQQNKCSIIAPQWLTVKELDKIIQYEKKHTDRFSAMPWSWLVIAQLLFKKAPDDFHDSLNELRGRIQDLREIRQQKILQGLEHLNESHLQLDNLSLLEINELRPFIVNTMDELRRVHTSANTFDASQQYQDEV